MRDVHGEHVCYLHIDDARELLKQGAARTYGSKKRIHGIQLVVELEERAMGLEPGRAMTAANYAGCRFVFKQFIDCGHGKMVVYRLKNLEISESPEHALLRILTAPALEAPIYIRRTEATDEERAADPGQERRKRQREIFRFSHVFHFAAQETAPAIPTREPIRPILPLPILPASLAAQAAA